MLHPLPFTTFGEIAALRLKTRVYCSACYEHRPIDPAAERPICTTEAEWSRGQHHLRSVNREVIRESGRLDTRYGPSHRIVVVDFPTMISAVAGAPVDAYFIREGPRLTANLFQPAARLRP